MNFLDFSVRELQILNCNLHKCGGCAQRTKKGRENLKIGMKNQLQVVERVETNSEIKFLELAKNCPKKAPDELGRKFLNGL